jgi:hypothetical protein
VSVKNGVFWDVTTCASCKNRRFGGTYMVFLRNVRRLLVTANVFLVHRLLSLWWRRRYVPPKRRFLQESHGVTSQKTLRRNSSHRTSVASCSLCCS